MEKLPESYDVIVIGTGMTGSVVAAAFSRIGKTVLHLDENDYYGENWASFNLESIESWLKRNGGPSEPPEIDPSPFLAPSEKFFRTSRPCLCENLKQQWHCSKAKGPISAEVVSQGVSPAITEISKSDAEPTELGLINRGTENEAVGDALVTIDEPWTDDKLKKEYRKFNLDICPKMLYSRGPLVELLISSNIARYAEFKSISRVLTWRDNKLEVVPSSRADVFASKNVTVVQKRMLVKILTIFADYPASKQEFEGYEDKSFVDYLKHKKLPDQLIHYIVYAIAMGSDSTPCMQGVLACQRFLLSLGRYGNTPFIFSLYGSGELPQCFCRLCAVFGGIYHLNRPVDGYIINEEGKTVAVVTGGQRLTAKHFVVSSAVCPDEFLTADTSAEVTRGIFITDRSIIVSEKEAITLLQFPPDKDHQKPVTVFEVGSACHVSPRGLFVVHMTSEGDSISHVSTALFGSDQEGLSGGEHPNVLWSLTWGYKRGSQCVTSNCPPNLKVYSGPDPGLDFDVEVERAKEIFHEFFPDEEFLPRAPDPEEIVMEDPEVAESTGADNFLESAEPHPESTQTEEDAREKTNEGHDDSLKPTKNEDAELTDN